MTIVVGVITHDSQERPVFRCEVEPEGDVCTRVR